MRMIDYYNIAATVLMALIICAAGWMSLRKVRHGHRTLSPDSGAAGKKKDHRTDAGDSAASGDKIACRVDAEETVSSADADKDMQRTDAAEEKRRRGGRFCGQRWIEGRGYWIVVLLVLAFGAFLRLWNLEGVPYGMQQDEASIGYEAYSLATYGIDRNGYSWPVYPITWGSGGGSPIMIYLNVITSLLFGSSVWSVRIVPAFLGTLTLVLFFVLLQTGFGRRTALAGLLILSVTPWHVILSRWSLDSNTTPFWQLLATVVFLLAVTGFHGQKGEPETSRHSSTGLLCLSAFLFGVCMYSYGSANVVVPLTLLFLAVRGVRQKWFTPRQLAGCFVTFAATCIPLVIFYTVNFLDLPEIATQWISFPKFTSSHFSSVFVALDASLPASILSNLKGLLQTLTTGFEDEVAWNTMPEYWTLYKFTWPLLFAGIAWAVRTWWKDRRTGEITPGSVVNTVMTFELAAAVIFTLFINASVNREVLLFLPLVYCLVMGLRWIWHAGAGVMRGLVRSRRQDNKWNDESDDLPAAAAGACADPTVSDAARKSEAADAAGRRAGRQGYAGAAGRIPAYVAMLLILVGAASFCKDYYGGYYNTYAAEVFMPGYGEAMVYADELAQQMDEDGAVNAGSEEADAGGSQGATVYSTYNLVSSPYMLTLFYTRYDTYEFMDTVVYRDEEAEFRVATSFGHFVFGLPVEDTSDLSALMEEEYWGDVFVLTRAEAEQFDASLYEITWFGDRFAVVVRRQDLAS